MATSDLKSLPARARKRIERLESAVSELQEALDRLSAQVHGAGVDRVARKASAAAMGLATAAARGEAARVEWVRSGEVVSAKVLADKWGLTPQALGPAAERTEVFSIVVKRRRYYPREFLELDRSTVSEVSKGLGSLSAAEKLVFWKRRHGALGGKTLLQVLNAAKGLGPLARVVRLAQEWSETELQRSIRQTPCPPQFAGVLDEAAPEANELTSQAAAKLLHVSRKHLDTLVESGKLGDVGRTAGGHRRISKDAVLRYKLVSKARQAKALDVMVESTERLGLYDREVEDKPARNRRA